jgi:hypothetical protein
MKVGQEHIISVVNTLGLAYVSVAMPLIMYLTIYNQTPLWVTLNSEMIAEEVIRTLVGSATLLLAVPITTILSARFLRNPKPESLQTTTVKEPAPISNSPKIAKSSFKPKLLNPFKKLSFFNKPKKTASLDKLDKSLKTPKLQNLSDEDQLVNKLKEFNTLLEQKANQTQENVLEDDYNIITDSQKPETKEPLPASNSTQTQNLPEQNKPVTPSQSKQPEPFQDYEQNPSVSDFPEATQTKKRIQL